VKTFNSFGPINSPVDGLENGQKIFGIGVGIGYGRQIADASRLIWEGQQDLDEDRLLVSAELSSSFLSRHSRSVYNGGLISTCIKL
jgi:hypothetical protein